MTTPVHSTPEHTLYTPDRDSLATLLDGEPRYRLDQLWQGLYTSLADPDDIMVGTVNEDFAIESLAGDVFQLGNISYRLGADLPATELLPSLEKFPHNDNFQDTLQRTLDHLRDNGVAVDNLKVRMGQQLAIDTAAENFPNHPAANAMLTREYRAPFVVPGPGQV